MTLEEARAELLPGLWAWAEENAVQADIEVGKNADCLIVLGWKVLGEPLAFAISRTRILDGLHRAEFGTNLAALAAKINAQEAT